MKKVIRRNVFETNSSSMHSIVVMKDDVRTDLDHYNDAYLYDGELSLREDKLYFGRSPFRILSNAIDKYSYALASMVGNNSYGHINKNNTLDEYLQKLVDQFVDLAKEIFNGCTGVEFPTDFNDRIFFGSVDHQSMELLGNFLYSEGIDIKEFIINPKYIAVIDGDESYIFDSMKNAGMINNDNIEKEFCDCDDDYTDKDDE